MECTLATLIACFSWSGIYLDTGIAYKETGEHFTLIEHAALRTESGELVQESSRVSFDSAPRNIYGHFAIGYELRFDSVVINLEALSHDSSLETSKDRGENSYRLNLRWFPFR
jgi:hypothetical protein